jgi:hypothetical protein
MKIDLTKKANKLPLSFKQYKKLVESIKYKDFSISLLDVAKFPGEYCLEYKYCVSCPNWEGSGLPGNRIIFPAKLPFKLKPKKFTGFTFDFFDNRKQFSKTRLYNWLKDIANRERYMKDKK